MLTKREWNSEVALANGITEALERDFNVFASSEKGAYNEDGFILIRTEDGRKFYLELWEHV